MKIHCFQHVSFEGPAYISDWLTQNNYCTNYTNFYKPGYTIPALSEVDVLIVMGGPMSVYDDHLYPWLAEEKAFITEAIKAGKKILGICLGAQLIALCCGARVKAARCREIGWFPVHPTNEPGTPAWFSELFAASPKLLHWHGDQFEIPEGAVNLAYSEANTNQAFMIGNHILGLQFHAEVTRSSITGLIDHCKQDIMPTHHPYTQGIGIIIHREQPVEQANALMAAILKQMIP
jgi:GMP synthase-like glutamine amidotransferase